MELEKTTAQEIKAMGAEKMKEIETEIRKGILDLRMSLVQLQPADVAKKRELKRTLARVLTVRSENKRNNGVAKA